MAVVTRALATGTPLTVHDGFDARAVEGAAADGCTLVSLVPTALRRVDAGRFRTVVLGGSAMPPDLPPNAATTYGMTETGSGVVYDGLPLDGVEVQIVEGEVQLRAPMLLRAYRDGSDPRTADGWYPTGDAGDWDDTTRRLRVVGRIGDVIVTGGEKVWPAAVERVLGAEPGVAEVAVVGRPDPEWGQRVVALVVPADPADPPSLGALRDAVKAELAAYAAPASCASSSRCRARRRGRSPAPAWATPPSDPPIAAGTHPSPAGPARRDTTVRVLVAPSRAAGVRAALLAVAVALAFADASIVVLALPPIYGEFDTTVVGVSWVITSYALVVAVVGLVLALARRRMVVPAVPTLRAGLATFALSSVVCGVAPSMGWLVAARCVQAVGATLLLSGALGVLEAARGSRAGRQIWSLAATAGLAVGPALGGVLTEAFDWRAIFLAQAPVALAALLVGADRTSASEPEPAAGRDAQPPTVAAWLADLALVLTSAALVGALFLGVLLVIEVWRYSPVAGAAVVSALPVGVFAVRPVTHVAPATARAAVGCVGLAAGLAALAFLPAPSSWWAAAALAVCGVGFGLVDPVVGGVAETAGPDAVRAGARTVAARHAGLVLGLVVIAPVLAADLDTGAERAVIAGADTMLDARLPVRDKVGVAQAVADLVDRTPRGKMPDVSEAFADAEVEGAEADRAAADLVARLEDVLTRSFRRVFLIAAAMALVALVPAVAASRVLRRRTGDVPARVQATGPPAWIGAAALGAVVALAAGLLIAEGRAGARAMGEVVEADPCTATADPYSGDGLDPTLQRIALGALNGAACDLGVSRERLVLSLADVPGIGSVPLDRDDIESALEAGLLRSIDDADDRGSMPGWVAAVLRFAARNAPIGWIVDGLDLPDRLPG